MTMRLRSLAFAGLFYGGSVPVVLAAPLAALAGRRALRGYAHGWMRFHGWSVRHLLGIRLRIEGAPPPGPALYACKHQAMFETLELPRILGSPAVVMKRELARIPVWGWVARRYGVIVVDRAASATALRAMLVQAKAAKAAGRPVVIFPEGTRVLPGETPPLRAGFAGLYRGLDLPVVPVAVDSGLLWPKRGPKQAGTITLRFGEAIPPGLPRREAETTVHAAINALEPESDTGNR